MGTIWLPQLPDWLTGAGLDVDTYPGWETRARSSGGYEKVLGIGVHHDASSITSSEASVCAYAWKNADARPVGAIRLGRDGHIVVGAAGATNTMGRGGPLKASRGAIPRDQGNLYMVAIEAGNNGVGEPWGRAMLDAYITMIAVLCDELELVSSDVWSHAGYCAPTCPGRKIDPAGPTPTYPNLGGSAVDGKARTWSDAALRAYVDAVKIPGPTPPEPEPEPEPTPEPEPEPPMTDDDIARIAKAVWDYAMTEPTTGKPSTTGKVLGYTRQAASNADKQTKPPPAGK